MLIGQFRQSESAGITIIQRQCGPPALHLPQRTLDSQIYTTNALSPLLTPQVVSACEWKYSKGY
jgi:hypothetical protein